MKAIFGQYGKVIVLVLAVIPLILFLNPAGDNSFYSIVKKNATPKAGYGKEDNGIVLDEIAARKEPVITIRKTKMKENSSYNFMDYVSVSFQDTNATNQKIFISKIIPPTGNAITDETTLSSPIQVKRGVYIVTYRAQETYKGVTKHYDKSARFIVD